MFQRRGWRTEGKWLRGYYRTRYGAFEGKIRRRMEGPGDFYIRNPPSELKRHRHWACFSKSNDGWYSLHFATVPKSTCEGIKAMELMLLESFRTT